MAAKHRLLRNLLIWALIPALMAGCSTRKNTFTRRAYHNLNAHYNAYWNGNESLKSGILELNKSARDNYTIVLPVYNYGTEANAQTINPNMDRAIEKASKVIQRHSMNFNDKEYVRWVMQSYLLIGKANYYKQDYAAARRAFEFVSKKYAYDPIHYESMLWTGRSYQKLKQYDRALTIFDEISEEAKTKLLPWSVRKALPLAYGDLFIAQSKYTKAREQLEKGIELQSGSKLKTRLNFILGQLYQIEGKDTQAGEFYTRVIKGSPSFEMAFNARINLARVFDAARSDRRMIVKELEKMLRDNKNDDFRDQIYFALADIAFKEKNDTLGMLNLRKSVAYSVDNDYQKSISALRLADLYFNKAQYGFAQLYYDTTLSFLPKEFPDYEKISTRTEIVTRLVENLQVIFVQDSLQALANMSEADRNLVIDKAIKEYVKREEEKQAKAAEEQLALEAGIALGGKKIVNEEGTTVVGGGGWYFYNPSAIGMGTSEFIRKWGRRRLEDNWRLSNKRVVEWDLVKGETAAADSLQADGKGSVNANDLRDPKTYLAQLPLTPEKIEISNGQISEALFNAGVIYLDELMDAPKAEETFNTLIERFPSDSSTLQAEYHLYRIARDRGDSTLMAYHKQQIINKYPDSDYARILIDPGYKAELEAASNRVKTLYEETWQAFQNELYRMVIIYCNDALSKYAGHDLMPQFAYLRALAIGKTVSPDSMKVDLAQIKKDYASSDVIPYVNTLLGVKQTVAETVKDEKGDTTKPVEAPVDISMYSYDPNAGHFYVLLVDGNAVNVYGIKVRISDFNTKNYKLKSLQVNSVVMENNRQMITVSSFNNSKEAMSYLNHIQNDTYVFSGIAEGTFDQFAISATNYPIFFKEKKIAPYLQFFRKNYPQEKNQ